MSDFGAEVRQIRGRRRWTIQQLAKRAGIDPTTLLAVESGRRKPIARTEAAIRDALGMADARPVPAPTRTEIKQAPKKTRTERIEQRRGIRAAQEARGKA